MNTALNEPSILRVCSLRHLVLTSTLALSLSLPTCASAGHSVAFTLKTALASLKLTSATLSRHSPLNSNLSSDRYTKPTFTDKTTPRL
jgi:hypothetical protein